MTPSMMTAILETVVFSSQVHPLGWPPQHTSRPPTTTTTLLHPMSAPPFSCSLSLSHHRRPSRLPSSVHLLHDQHCHRLHSWPMTDSNHLHPCSLSLARSAEGLAPKGSGQESCRPRRRSPRAGRTLGPRFGSPGSPGRLLTMSALSRGLASRTRRSTKTSQTQSASLRCRMHLPHLCTALRSCAFTLLKYEGSLRHSSAHISLLDHARSVGSHGIVVLLHPLSISLLSH